MAELTSADSLDDTSIEVLIPMCSEAVTALDTSLGRPPFANPSSEGVREDAQKLLLLLQTVCEKRHRRQSLSTQTEITTTLPILCASLRQGSENEKPCLVLYEMMLSALTFVSSLSTFPMESILKDAEELLPVDSIIRFRFTVAVGALTVERMRSLLGLPPVSSQPPQADKQKKASKKTKGSGNQPQSSPAGASRATAVPPPPQLFRALLEAPLEPACRDVLVSLFNNTEKFLTLVQDNGELADAILNVYGDVLIPLLKPSSLLPALDEHLINHFVDILETHGESLSLLTEKNFLTVPLSAWDTARITRICKALHTRQVSAPDAFGTLVVCVFTIVVLVEKRRSGSSLKCTDYEQCINTLWEDSITAALKLPVSTGTSSTSVVDARGSFHIETDNRWLRPLCIMADLSLDDALPKTQLEDTDDEGDTHSRVAPSVGVCVKIKPLMEDLLVPAISHVLSCKPLTSSQSAASKSGGGGGGKKKKQSDTKNQAQPSCALSKTTDAVATPPVPFSTFLQWISRLSLFSMMIMDNAMFTSRAVKLIHATFLYYESKQSQRLSGSVWASYLHVVELLGWQIRLSVSELDLDDMEAVDKDSEKAAPLRVLGDIEDTLASGTVTSSYALWCTPFLLPHPLLDGVMTHAVQQFDKLLVEGLATTLIDKPNSQNKSPFMVPPACALLGMFCNKISATQCSELSKTLSKNTVILPYLSRLLEEHIKGSASSPNRRAWLLPTLKGIRRLRKQLNDDCTAEMVDQNAKEEAESAASIERIMKQLELAEEHKSFVEKQKAVHDEKEAEAARIREAYEARLRRDAIVKEEREREAERKLQLAAEATQQQLEETKEIRDREQRTRHQERLAVTQRAAAFLEGLSLDVSASRLQELKNAIQPVIDVKSRAELLEFLVTGSFTLPADMRVAVPSAAHGISFWDDVSNTTWEDLAAEVSEASKASTKLSFHNRFRFLLDCFYYGINVSAITVAPDPLPSISISDARAVISKTELKKSNVHNVVAALRQLQQRLLVTLQGDTATLTRLGYLYHAPHWRSSDNLSARIERSKALGVSLPGAEDSDGSDDELEYDYDQADEEESSSDENFLPEVEFTI